MLRRGHDTELVPDIVEAAGVRMDVERHEVSVNGDASSSLSRSSSYWKCCSATLAG